MEEKRLITYETFSQYCKLKTWAGLCESKAVYSTDYDNAKCSKDCHVLKELERPGVQITPVRGK